MRPENLYFYRLPSDSDVRPGLRASGTDDLLKFLSLFAGQELSGQVLPSRVNNCLLHSLRTVICCMSTGGLAA